MRLEEIITYLIIEDAINKGGIGDISGRLITLDKTGERIKLPAINESIEESVFKYYVTKMPFVTRYADLWW